MILMDNLQKIECINQLTYLKVTGFSFLLGEDLNSSENVIYNIIIDLPKAI